MVWDAARFTRGSPSTLGNGIDRTVFGYPTSGASGKPDPNFHGRHPGDQGNVLWADGHASATPVRYFDYPTLGFPNIEIAKMKAGHVGVIDADGNFSTNDNYDPAY
jgi:prepilin-type processing-associated H-X9-DG protein